jgi:hypothetical protein
MPPIGGAADCVFSYDDTIAVIDRAKSSRKNTDVGFGTCENKRITVPSHQFIVQKMTGEGRINRLVDHQSGGSQIWKRRHELQQSGVDMFSRRLPPFFVVAAPHSRHILRPLRRDKPRKNCSFWKSLYDRSGAGKHGFNPRCRPNPVRSEDALHVNAKVHGVWRKPKVLVRVHHHEMVNASLGSTYERCLLWASIRAFSSSQAVYLASDRR